MLPVLTSISSPSSVSATHLDVPGYGGILLDCGEGTLGQLARSVGLAELDKVLADLKVVFISHMHADHHSGIIRLLAKRRQVSLCFHLSASLDCLQGPKLTLLVYLGSAQVTEHSNPLFVIGP